MTSSNINITVQKPDSSPSSATAVVLGGGSFGTVLANIMAHNNAPTYLWLRDEHQAQKIQTTGINERYLPGYKLHPKLNISTDVKNCVQAADIVFFSIPSSGFRGLLEQVQPFIRPEQYLVSTTKGIDAQEFLLMSQLLERYFPANALGVISGPNLAKEIADKHPSATVVASANKHLKAQVQTLMQSSLFRVYSSDDCYGVELGGALKNIYAIASGICGALALGENTRGMLMTRSLAEMSRLAVLMGANPMTFLGLSGVGDLIVTCSSPLSRNYRVGYALGQGKTIEEAVASLGAVAEGVNTLALVKHHADSLKVTMPLVDALYSLVHGEGNLDTLINSLMARYQSTDVEFST